MNKYFLLKVLSVFIATVSQILLKKSANKEYNSRIKEYFNIFVIIGYGLFFCSSVLTIFSLKGITIAHSTILESLSYILVPTLSYLLLHERINSKQFIGMIIIVIGIIIYYNQIVW